MGEAGSLIAEGLYKQVAKYIVEHSVETVNPYNELFLRALESVTPNAAELLYRAAETTIEKTVEVKGYEPGIDAGTLVEWLGRYRDYADDAELATVSVFTRLTLLDAMLRGDAWIDQVGQNLVVIETEGGSRFTLTKSGILY